MDFDWKSAVRAVAPAIGTALGGPLAGAAVSALGNVLLGNPDATEDQVAQAVASGRLTGDNVVALKSADLSFKAEMAKIAADTEKAYLADTANARQQTVDLAKAESPIAWGASVVSLMVVGGFFICVWLLFFVDRPWDERTAGLLNVLFGALTIGFGQVCNYWLGSSAGSARSSNSIRKIAEQQSKP